MKKTIVFLTAILSLAFVVGPVATKQAGADQTILKPTATAATQIQPVARVIHMRVTAYTSVPDETDDTPFITASGRHVADGIVATNILPFGTRIMIPSLFGNKIFTVEDRMSRHFMNTVDIWMPSKAKAIFFGLNYADIEVLQETLAVK